MSENALRLMSSYFSSLWHGLKLVIIPGTDWSVADFFLAIFIAGMVGIVLSIAFKLFNNHFGRGAQLSANKRFHNERNKEK